MLSNQVLLAKIATETRDNKVRDSAIAKLTDHAQIEKVRTAIAKHTTAKVKSLTRLRLRPTSGVVLADSGV